MHPRLSMREIGRRTLSLSGSWVDRLTNRSSTPPPSRPQPKFTRPSHSSDNTVAFPSLPELSKEDPPLRRSPSVTATRRTTSRPRTPSAARISGLRHQHRFGLHASGHASPISPLYRGVRPQIQRSASGHDSDGFGPLPRSAKRFARSAHLHEVKSAGALPLSERKQRDNETIFRVLPRGTSNAGAIDLSEDMFDSGSNVSTTTPSKSRSKRAKGRQQLSPLRLPGSQSLPFGCVNVEPAGEVDTGGGDAWVDTDATGSDFE